MDFSSHSSHHPVSLSSNFPLTGHEVPDNHDNLSAIDPSCETNDFSSVTTTTTLSTTTNSNGTDLPNNQTGPKKNFKTEYKSKFTPFNQYVYNQVTDSFVKQPVDSANPMPNRVIVSSSSNQDLTSNESIRQPSHTPDMNTQEVGVFEPTNGRSDNSATGAEPWYKECVRRHERANEYRFKSEVGHNSPLLNINNVIVTDTDNDAKSTRVDSPLDLESSAQLSQSDTRSQHSDQTSAMTKLDTPRQGRPLYNFTHHDYKRDNLIARMADNNSFKLPKDQTPRTTQPIRGKTAHSAVPSRIQTRSATDSRARSQSSRRNESRLNNDANLAKKTPVGKPSESRITPVRNSKPTNSVTPLSAKTDRANTTKVSRTSTSTTPTSRLAATQKRTLTSSAAAPKVPPRASPLTSNQATKTTPSSARSAIPNRSTPISATRKSTLRSSQTPASGSTKSANTMISNKKTPGSTSKLSTDRLTPGIAVGDTVGNINKISKVEPESKVEHELEPGSESNLKLEPQSELNLKSELEQAEINGVKGHMDDLDNLAFNCKLLDEDSIKDGLSGVVNEEDELAKSLASGIAFVNTVGNINKTSLAEPEPELKLEPEHEPQREPRLEFKPEPEPELQPEPEREREPQPELVLEPEREPLLGLEPELVLEPEREPLLGLEPELVLEPGREPLPELGLEPEREPQPKLELQPEREPQPVIELEPERQPQPVIELEPEREPQPQPQPELGLEHEDEPQPELVLELDREPELVLEPEREPQPELEPKLEAQSELKPESESESESESELESESDLKLEPQSELNFISELEPTEINVVKDHMDDIDNVAVNCKLLDEDSIKDGFSRVVNEEEELPKSLDNVDLNAVNKNYQNYDDEPYSLMPSALEQDPAGIKEMSPSPQHYGNHSTGERSYGDTSDDEELLKGDAVSPDCVNLIDSINDLDKLTQGPLGEQTMDQVDLVSPKAPALTSTKSEDQTMHETSYDRASLSSDSSNDTISHSIKEAMDSSNNELLMNVSDLLEIESEKAAKVPELPEQPEMPSAFDTEELILSPSQLADISSENIIKDDDLAIDLSSPHIGSEILDP